MMLPEGWEHIRLREGVSKIGSGVTPRGGEESYKSTGYPLIRSQNVGWGFLSLDNVSHIDLDQHNAMSGTKLKSGDVLLNITGASIGRVATYYGEDLGANVNQHVCIIRTDGSLEPRFVEAFLLSEFGQKQVDQFQAGGNRQGLNFEQVGSFRLPRPPLPEQRKIAEILSIWDAAIGAQERLIANATRQKKALMQSLLPAGTHPPQKRLPGFSGDWVPGTLEQAAHIIVSNVDKKSGEGEQPVRLCNYMDVYRADRIEADMPFMRATAAAAQIRKFSLRVGDVLITKDSETPEDIAVPSYVASTAPDLVCGYHLAIIRAKPNTDGQFLKYYFEQPTTQDFFASRANGATRFGLTIGAIESAPITLPSLAEQQRIGEVIAVAELEIHRLLPIAQTLRQEKSALMQQLLTGKRRVKVAEREAA